MAYIWLLILAGVIIIPIISGTAKELERRLEKSDGISESDKKTGQKKEDLKFAVKLLTYGVVIIFIIIVIIMAKFISQIIYSN